MLPQIPGVLVRGPELRELRARVSTLTGSRNPSAFPGAQPISFAACHLRELENDPYFVSEKADGIRCLLFTTHDTPGRGVSYLIDRKNSFYRLELGLPIPSRGPTRWYKDTLLDGELVLDEYEDKTVVLWFLLFDCVVIGGKSLKERPYHKRLGYLKEQILNPYKYLLQTDPQYKSQQPFRMDLKPLQLAYHLEAVFEDMAHLKHKSDGIIFTSRDAPYTLGTCEKMLKWKPAEENTVDFKIRVENAYSRNPSFYICLWEGQDRYSDYAEFHLSSEQYKEWCRNPPQGAIVECRYDPEWPGRWRFSRFRDDKREANHMNTYTKIMESIRDGVSEEQLRKHALVIRAKWKEREGQSAIDKPHNPAVSLKESEQHISRASTGSPTGAGEKPNGNQSNHERPSSSPKPVEKRKRDDLMSSDEAADDSVRPSKKEKSDHAEVETSAASSVVSEKEQLAVSTVAQEPQDDEAVNFEGQMEEVPSLTTLPEPEEASDRAIEHIAEPVS